MSFDFEANNQVSCTVMLTYPSKGLTI